METHIYPDIETLREATKNYLNKDDPEFLAKYSDKKWINLFEKKIHGIVNNLINNLLYIKNNI